MYHYIRYETCATYADKEVNSILQGINRGPLIQSPSFPLSHIQYLQPRFTILLCIDNIHYPELL